MHERRRGEDPQRRRAAAALDQLVGGLGDAEAGGEEVGLAPQHALGHARWCRRCRGCRGRRGTRPSGRRRARRRPGRPRRRRRRARSGAPEPSSTCRSSREVGEATAAPRPGSAAKAPWKTTAAAPAVGQDVAQLLGHVAVVDVDRRAAGLGRAEHPLEVLVAVVEVERDVVVRRLPGAHSASGRGRRGRGRAADAASRRVRSVTSAHVSRRSRHTMHSRSGTGRRWPRGARPGCGRQRLRTRAWGAKVAPSAGSLASTVLQVAAVGRLGGHTWGVRSRGAADPSSGWRNTICWRK